MANPARGFRLLILLALLQFVGGPAVLVGIAALGKIGVSHMARDGVSVGLGRALQSVEWQTACNDLNAAVNDCTAPKAPAKDLKTKHGKTVSHLLAWSNDPVLLDVDFQEMRTGQDSASLISTWPNGPPVPPPRLG